MMKRYIKLYEAFVCGQPLNEGKVEDAIKHILDKIVNGRKNIKGIMIGVNNESLNALYPADNREQLLYDVTKSVSQKVCHPVFQTIKQLSSAYTIEIVDPEPGSSKYSHYVVLNCTAEEALEIYNKAVGEFKNIAKGDGSTKIKDFSYKTRGGGIQYYTDAEYVATKPETDSNYEESYYFYPCVWMWSPKRLCN